MNNDIISDTLARIRNAGLVGKTTVASKKSKLIKSVLKVMEDEGFISGVEEGDRELIISLKYDSRGVPVIREMKRKSKSSRRVYVKSEELKNLRRKNFALSIISTSQGVLSDNAAYSKGIGGELLCEVY